MQVYMGIDKACPACSYMDGIQHILAPKIGDILHQRMFLGPYVSIDLLLTVHCSRSIDPLSHP